MNKPLLVINLLVLLLLISLSVSTYLFDYDLIWTGLSGIGTFFWLLYLSRSLPIKSKKATLKTISLIDEQEKVVKVWHIDKEQGLLIGKSSPQHEVDLDLSAADYAVLIDQAHATLNCVNNQWYVEDLASANGTGVKLPNQNEIRKLQEKERIKVGQETRIYLGKTILQLNNE